MGARKLNFFNEVASESTENFVNCFSAGQDDELNGSKIQLNSNSVITNSTGASIFVCYNSGIVKTEEVYVVK